MSVLHTIYSRVVSRLHSKIDYFWVFLRLFTFKFYFLSPPSVSEGQLLLLSGYLSPSLISKNTCGKARKVFKIQVKWLQDESPGSFLLTNSLINKCLSTVLGTVCWVGNDFMQSCNLFWLLRSCLLPCPLPPSSFSFMAPNVLSLMSVLICQTETP